MFKIQRSSLITNSPIGKQAFSVTEVNTMVADAITTNLPHVLWVGGEVSNLSMASSGHRYLSLQDGEASISCALFRGSAGHIHTEILKNLRNGDKVVVKASVSVYKPRGSYQLIINDIEPAGFGELAKKFVILKQKLDSQGLTSQERKRSIPSWPKHIAVVTSAMGAAVRDVISTLARRAPFIPVTVYPTKVQGDLAPESIIGALARANNYRESVENPRGHDIILLVRGGGSIEDLIAFNDEALAYAVANSQLPVVTGVGHETDFTIVDFVSDYRAPTPTGAAEIVSPDKLALQTSLSQQQSLLLSRVMVKLTQLETQINHYHRRLSLQHPTAIMTYQYQRIDEIDARIKQQLVTRINKEKSLIYQYNLRLKSRNPQWQLQQTNQQLLKQTERFREIIHQRINKYQQELKGLNARLVLLSPLGILDRGYALVFDEKGRLLKNVEQVNPGLSIHIHLAEGELEATINKLSKIEK